MFDNFFKKVYNILVKIKSSNNIKEYENEI